MNQTKSIYIWTRFLTTPFWAIYNILPFILLKDLHATPFQLTLIIALKPLVSILSIYWSNAIYKRPDRLVSNIIWANLLGHFPFLFCPYFDSPWFFIAAFGFYMMLARGVTPAWMEVLKRNLPKESREQVFAYGTLVGYMGNAFIPLTLGFLLDGYQEAWRYIFPCAALLSFLAIAFQLRIPIEKIEVDKTAKMSLSKPWKDAWNLIKSRSDFRLYQIGFMLGGGGLMIIARATPDFFVDVLNLTYTQITLAKTACTGIGFVLTTPFWTKWLQRIDIYRFSGLVTALAGLFPLCMVLSPYYITWLFVAHFIYGTMQAGSEMSWNLSGTIFAKEEDSSVFTSVNVLMVGLRGSVAPALGWLLCCYGSPTIAMLLGGVLCFLGTERMFAYSRNFALQSVKS